MEITKSLGNFSDQITFNGNTMVGLNYKSSGPIPVMTISVTPRLDHDHSTSIDLLGCDEVALEKIGLMFLDLAREVKINKLEGT